MSVELREQVDSCGQRILTKSLHLQKILSAANIIASDLVGKIVNCIANFQKRMTSNMTYDGHKPTK